MFVIGSVAAKAWISNFREANDVDVWMLPKDFVVWYERNLPKILRFWPQRNPNKYFAEVRDNDNSIILEILLLQNGPHKQIYEAQKHDRTINIAGTIFKVASLETLIKLKRSHLEHPLRWNKHIEDYSALRAYLLEHTEHVNDQNNTVLEEAYQELYSRTNIKYRARAAKLNMGNGAFFAKSEASVRRVIEHDAIHRAVMFYDKPMYELLKIDPNKAYCSKNLWNGLAYEDKIKTVQEEAQVIALERKIIPAVLARHTYNTDEAFAWALMRICTTLTSGWFRDFAIDNWAACSNLGFDYVSNARQNLNINAIFTNG